MGEVQCAECGRSVSDRLNQCPHCGAWLESAPLIPGGTEQGGPEMRRGLLYMLLAAVFYYFAAGYSPLTLPLPFSRWLTGLALPLFFLAGFALVIFGFYRRITR